MPPSEHFPFNLWRLAGEVKNRALTTVASSPGHLKLCFSFIDAAMIKDSCFRQPYVTDTKVNP